VEVFFKEYVNGNENHFLYEGEDASLIVTINRETSSCHGHATLADGTAYSLEYCGDGEHVFKQYDTSKFPAHESIDEGIVPTEDLSTDDISTVVTYSIKIYYTEEFAKVTSDIQGFVDQIIAETNQGYKNSKIPLKIKVHCVEKASISETRNVVSMIMNFRKMKSGVEKLRGTADVACLLVNKFDSCGVGFVNGLFSGSPISVVQKSCAVGYFSFGHEIGHNVGLHHNKDSANNPYYPEGHGFLIKGGYRTILAYSASGHQTRVNYYSNPLVNLPYNGQPTGKRKTANNAQVLIKNRFYLAALGDESETCGTNAAPQKPEIPAVESNDCPVYQNTGIRYKFSQKKEHSTRGKCRDSCKNDRKEKCVQWMWRNHRNSGFCYHLTTLFIDSAGFTSGLISCQGKPSCQYHEKAGLAYQKYSFVSKDAVGCRNVICPRNAECSLFAYQSDTKTCHLILTYPKARDGFFTGTPCA